MKFFSLTKYIRYLVKLEEQDSEDVGLKNTSGLLSSSSLVTLSIPAIAIASVPAYSYIRSKFNKSNATESGLEKLSELVDALTKDESVGTALSNTSWIIPTETIRSNIPVTGRKSPAALGLSGRIPDKGTYTQQEADYILGLRSKSIDTTAYKTRMHPSIEALIRSKAAEYGVDQDIAVKIAVVESGGNPNAISSTGAIGVYQFTGATANLIGLADRFNIADNIDAGIRLIAADKKFVGKFNTSVATYLALQIGGPNAKYVLTSDPSTRISDLPVRIQNTVKGNLGGASATIGDYIAVNATALEEKIKQQRTKPEYVYDSPVKPQSTKPVSINSTAMPRSPTTMVVRETRPTSTQPAYTTEGLTSPDVQVEPFNGTYVESIIPVPPAAAPLQSVVRHKSGLYFNTR